jgi:pheromone alpha factor receptor
MSEPGSFTIDEGVPGVRPGQFDIFNQTFQLIGPDGEMLELDTYDIEYVRLLAARTAIVFATQLGASFILLMILLLMTPNTKRRSLSWIFNVLALVCNVVRCVLQCLEMTGPFLNFVVIATQEYGAAGLNRHIRLAIANNVITTLVFIFIELALVTQVQVICAAAMSSLCRIATLSFCGLVATIAIGFRLNLMVINSISTAALGSPTEIEWSTFDTLQWAVSTSNTTAIVSICVFSGVFCIKLGLAIRSRRSMGLKQFGAMQIVFIMGCQTLTIPGRFLWLFLLMLS